MAMNPGADLDSLPILDNPDDFCCACLRRIYLGAFLRCHQQLPQLNSSGSYFTRSIQGNACSSLVCQVFGSTIYLVSQIESLLGVDITYALIC